MQELKRLFIAAEVVAPWPDYFPPGRVLTEANRHLTLAFLGDSHLPSLEDFPKPPFSIGIAGIFDKAVFLPPQIPRAAAWRVHLWEQEDLFLGYQKQILDWIKSKGFKRQRGRFLPHLTIARQPFHIHDWKEAFRKLPCFIRSIRICETVGLAHYETCSEIPVLAPFERISENSILIRGKTPEELYIHGYLALCFEEPKLIDSFELNEGDPVELLNRVKEKKWILEGST